MNQATNKKEKKLNEITADSDRQVMCNGWLATMSDTSLYEKSGKDWGRDFWVQSYQEKVIKWKSEETAFQTKEPTL